MSPTAAARVAFVAPDTLDPIVMFTEGNDTSHVRDAIAADVSAYVVAVLAPERVKPVLEVALARFEYEDEFKRERARRATNSPTAS